MRTASQLIQAALADPDFSDIRERPEHDSGPFKVFKVSLTTPRYRGLQPNWHFAVLRETEPHGSYENVRSSAQALIRKASGGPSPLCPLVFLSDTSTAVAQMCKVDPRNVYGIDRSRYLIRLARRRAKQSGLDVSFHEGDARRYRHRGELFHCVMLLGNSFGYFDVESDDEAVLMNVRRHLASNGTVVLDLTDGDWMRKNFQPRSWEWVDESHLVCRERALSSDGDRLISREVVVHSEMGVLTDQFYAERLYSFERITTLLERQGYSGIRNHGIVEAESSRGQDLGMMAHRLFITAKAPRREIKPTSAPKFRRSVTVFLGDPRLPDEVKRDGQFNAEDHDTVKRLKDALAELDGYEFEYLDDHEAMVMRLRKDPPEFVLNLCDEGYKNDAFKELHVPALLEMHGIPYTGAGPSCLGACYDKALVRAVAQSIDVPVPLESYCGPDDTSATLPSTFPALVKPNRGDSSLGITKDAVVHDTSELVAYVTWLRETFGRHGILVQEFLTGPEYSVAILGNPGLSFQALPPLVVDYSKLPKGFPPILSYESKWHPESPSNPWPNSSPAPTRKKRPGPCPWIRACASPPTGWSPRCRSPTNGCSMPCGPIPVCGGWGPPLWPRSSTTDSLPWLTSVTRGATSSGTGRSAESPTIIPGCSSRCRPACSARKKRSGIPFAT